MDWLEKNYGMVTRILITERKSHEIHNEAKENW